MTNPRKAEKPKTYLNTNKELYRETAESEGMSYYANSIHVTKQGGIGMNVGGYIIVLPIAEWHKLAKESLPTQEPTGAVPTPKLCEYCKHPIDEHGGFVSEFEGDDYYIAECDVPGCACYNRELAQALPTDKKLPEPTTSASDAIPSNQETDKEVK